VRGIGEVSYAKGIYTEGGYVRSESEDGAANPSDSSDEEENERSGTIDGG